ncbi:hypothetical protein ACFLYH_01365 [Candidatus Dependentiae bacterium]
MYSAVAGAALSIHAFLQNDLESYKKLKILSDPPEIVDEVISRSFEESPHLVSEVKDLILCARQSKGRLLFGFIEKILLRIANKIICFDSKDNSRIIRRVERILIDPVIRVILQYYGMELCLNEKMDQRELAGSFLGNVLGNIVLEGCGEMIIQGVKQS